MGNDWIQTAESKWASYLWRQFKNNSLTPLSVFNFKHVRDLRGKGEKSFRREQEIKEDSSRSRRSTPVQPWKKRDTLLSESRFVCRLLFHVFTLLLILDPILVVTLVQTEQNRIQIWDSGSDSDCVSPVRFSLPSRSTSWLLLFIFFFFFSQHPSIIPLSHPASPPSLTESQWSGSRGGRVFSFGSTVLQWDWTVRVGDGWPGACVDHKVQ